MNPDVHGTQHINKSFNYLNHITRIMNTGETAFTWERFVLITLSPHFLTKSLSSWTDYTSEHREMIKYRTLLKTLKIRRSEYSSFDFPVARRCGRHRKCIPEQTIKNDESCYCQIPSIFVPHEGQTPLKAESAGS